MSFTNTAYLLLKGKKYRIVIIKSWQSNWDTTRSSIRQKHIYCEKIEKIGRGLPHGLLRRLRYGRPPRTTLNKQPNLRLQEKETQKGYLLHLHDHNWMKTVAISFSPTSSIQCFFIFASFLHWPPDWPPTKTLFRSVHYSRMSISLIGLKCLPSKLTFAKNVIKLISSPVCNAKTSCKEGSKELLFSKCQFWWRAL